MTPEEKRVVQLAIDLWRAQNEISPASMPPEIIEIANELRIATQALVYACDGCNYDRHLCPGCGTWLPHGETDCGQDCTDRGEREKCDASTYPCWECTIDEDPAPRCDCRPEDFGTTHPGHACRLRAHDPKDCLNRPDVPTWVARTWRDVREGDRVRMPGTDAVATVQGAPELQWHVDPQPSKEAYERRKAWMEATGRTGPVVVPLEWSSITVTLLLADGSTRKLNADPDKPIEIELSSSEVNAIEAVGWENRVRIDK